MRCVHVANPHCRRRWRGLQALTPALCKVLFPVKANIVRHAKVLRAQFFDYLVQFSGVDEHLWRRIVYEVRQVVLLQHADVSGDGPQLPDAEHGHHIIQPVMSEQSHPVALANPQRRQRAGGFRAHFLSLGVCDTEFSI